ncbi:hypothetical protein QTG56_25965 (plasmid) [Rossellomorea sp. AcN35-11]|nr:hypothetical protein [Rossellomorea aquimaris]WJV32064.1 hypothetical protein QTG56_25965 [Rossellomorea sp. AcN35-11]
MKDIIKSTKDIQERTLSGIKSPFKQKAKVNKPFIIETFDSTVASETSPYQVKFLIRYGDKDFKKRIKNISKERKLILEYEQRHENTGSLFNPNYEWATYTKIRGQVLDSSTKLILEIVVPFAEYVLDSGNAKRLDNFHYGATYKLKTKEERDSLKHSITKKLYSFLEAEYEEYKKIV